jgi:hypothetical protein
MHTVEVDEGFVRASLEMASFVFAGLQRSSSDALIDARLQAAWSGPQLAFDHGMHRGKDTFSAVSATLSRAASPSVEAETWWPINTCSDYCIVEAL